MNPFQQSKLQWQSLTFTHIYLSFFPLIQTTTTQQQQPTAILFGCVGFFGFGWSGFNTKYTHYILATAAPFLIVAAVLGVCVPISIVLFGETHMPSVYGKNVGIFSLKERMQLEQRVNQNKQRSKVNDGDDEQSSDDDSSDSSSSSSGSSSEEEEEEKEKETKMD